MALVLFDLDNTLIGGDSDHAWGEYLVSRGAVDAEQYHKENQQFYQDYQQGRLDIHAYLRFALRPLSSIEPEQLLALRNDFMRDVVAGMYLPKAQKLVNQHLAEGHTCAVITSTNRFIAEPIVISMRIENLICSEPQMENDRYTGDYLGVPCYREGKVECLESWLEKRGESFEKSWCYSDSFNDLPLLNLVEYPIVVDPDPELKKQALQNDWPIISLRD